MERLSAFLLALLITCLIGGVFFLTSNLSKSQKENAILGRVIDGDTLELTDGRKIRLLNINAPEKSQNSHKLALNFLRKYENKSIEIEITDVDKYRRNLARVYTLDKKDNYLNLNLVKKGFASKFLVDDNELDLFKAAEATAITSSFGMWNKSNYYGCFIIDINKNKEIVVLKYVCKEVNMKNWVLKDESRKQYVFHSLVLARYSQVILHSNSGKNNSTDLFWNSKSNIWNNDRDSLYLFDADGGIAHYETYGY